MKLVYAGLLLATCLLSVSVLVEGVRPCKCDGARVDTGWSWKKWAAVGAGTAAAAVGAVMAAPVALGALGFGAAGIGGGTLAAWLMTLYGGTVTAGSLLAIFQSIGAAGMGITGMFVVGGGGAAVAGATIASLYPDSRPLPVTSRLSDEIYKVHNNRNMDQWLLAVQKGNGELDLVVSGNRDVIDAADEVTYDAVMFVLHRCEDGGTGLVIWKGIEVAGDRGVDVGGLTKTFSPVDRVAVVENKRALREALE